MLKNCYVNHSPRRSALVVEDINTGLFHVETTYNGETVEVHYLGEGPKELKRAQSIGMNWARNGDPSIEAQYAS